jgi:signal transduction histidine kinase
VTAVLRPAVLVIGALPVLYGVLAAVSFTEAGSRPIRSVPLHQPFVAALAAAATLAAVVAWRRFRVDRSGQSFLITVSFGALALLYAPHILLRADAADPAHLLFGPLSRAAFAVLLASAFLGIRVPARLLNAGLPLVLTTVAAAVAIDAAIHLGGARPLGGQPVVVLRSIEAAALVVQCVAAVAVARLWWRVRSVFLAAVTAGLTGLATGSALFLSTSPWLARWWVAHLGLLVCAACLVTGIGAERARRGHLAGVALLDLLPQLAEHVLDATSDGIAVRDQAGRLVGWNPAAVALTGWSRDQAEHRFNPEQQGLLDLGAGRWVDVRREEIRRYGADYTVTVFSDARAEMELHARQAELAAFAGVVAHDLKSPLNAVGGFLDLLDDTLTAHLTGPAGEDARHCLDNAHAGVQRMQRLINDLLAYTAARDGALQHTDVDLRTLVDEVVATRAADPAHRAHGDRRRPDIYVGPLPTVQGDPVLLRQVIDNLLGNALKYTPPGQPPRVTVTAQPDRDGWTAVEVADRGIGIPESQHAAIFERFHRAHPGTNYPGTGLGLAICQRIIERHGGVITATDNPGGGAIFRFTLPLAQTAPPTSKATKQRAPQLDPRAP